MDNFLLNLANNEGQRLVDQVKNEAQYLCCFDSYVENFEQEKKKLVAKHDDVEREIKTAKGVFSFKYDALQWKSEATDIIKFEIRKKKKCFFDLCPHCWWQYRMGKELAKRTDDIKGLLVRRTTDILAGRAYLRKKGYLASQEFIHLESRESKFQDLMKALEDDSCNMIALQGIGGTGKTYMAKEVGSELEGSRFDKVFVLEVSMPPNFMDVRQKFMQYLDLPLEKWKEEEYSDVICHKLMDMEERLLVILDDVWDVFNVTHELGIPRIQKHSVLLITRNARLCTAMRCEITIELGTLNDEDALDLFQKHVGNYSSRGLKGVPQKILKHCGGLPVAIVAVSEALKNRPTQVWKDALKSLADRPGDPLLLEAHKCLKFSYDNLKKEKAKELFLISSLFPKGFEISEQLLSIIGMGLGSFWDDSTYHSSRIEVLAAMMELKDYTLLLNCKGQCVKMHDLVYDVALRIRGTDFQVIIDSKMPINHNIRYLFWKNDDFLDEFGGKELELLLIFLDDSKDLKVSDTFFMEMKRLKVLILVSLCSQGISAPSLLHSLQPLTNIQTLALMKLKLGDISIIENLSSLVTLSLRDCSIIKLPEEFLKLKKLGLLELEMCEIKMNNPFGVIERCSQLEELSFVGNKCGQEEKDEIAQNESSLSLHRYQISDKSLSNCHDQHGFISKCFRLDDSRHLLSEETFKQLVGATELLILEGRYEERRWKNLIPCIVPLDDGGMNELIILHASSCPNIECLIDTKNHSLDVIAFSNLVELHLCEMDAENLYQGPMPSGFLEQLKIMKLKRCQKLKSMLFNGNLNLCCLESIELEDCPMLTSIFQQSTAQTLKQLEELRIKNCTALEYIIAHESSRGEIVDDGDHDQVCDGSLFLKLKTLQITGCDQLEIVLPILFAEGLPSLEEISICECKQLRYIFDKFVQENHDMLPSLKEMELCVVPSLIGIYKECQQPMASSIQKPASPLSKDNSKQIPACPGACAFSWAQTCFLNNSRTTNKKKRPDPIIQQGLAASRKWINAVDILKRLNVHHIKKLKIVNLSLKTASLFTLSMASAILWEELTIGKCIGLKHLISSEAYDSKDQIISIFPKLEKLEIWECKDLEFLFPFTTSAAVENLKYLTIKGAPELKYIIGNQHDDPLFNPNVMLLFYLPALKFLHFEHAPKMISICFMYFILALPSLVTLENCGIKSVTKLMVRPNEEHLNQEAIKEIHTSADRVPFFQEAQDLMARTLENIRVMKLQNCSELTSVLTLPVASTMLLEDLTIQRCHQLKCIVTDKGDAQVSINQCSIFPKLESLDISDCEELEFLFPATLSVELKNLKSLTVSRALELKYVIGKHQKEDHSFNQSQNMEPHFDLPSLQSLCLRDVPNLVSLCPENYRLRGLSLGFIDLEGSPNFSIRSITDFMVCGNARQQNSITKEAIEMHLNMLESLIIKNSKIEDIFNLMNLDMKENENKPLESRLQSMSLQGLSELRSVCVGPKHILRLNNVSQLEIKTCSKLEVVFSASTVRSLPQLAILKISDCEELVHIVEEDKENVREDLHHHEPCFPNLSELTIERCSKLKYLFSITVSGILPKLSGLLVKEASNLEHILIRQETIEMVMEDVFPELSHLRLDNLQCLVSICCGINFRALGESSRVHDCPKFSFHETTITQLQDGSKILDFEVEAETQQSTIGSPKFSRVTKEATKEIVEENVISEIADSNNASLKGKLVGKEEQNEKIMMNPQQPTTGAPDMAETSEGLGCSAILEAPNSKKTRRANQLTDSEDELVHKDVRHEAIKIDPCSLWRTKLDMIVEERVEEGASSETLRPCYLEVPPMSSNLTILPVGDVTSTTMRIWKEKEQGEDGGKNVQEYSGAISQPAHEALDTIQVSKIVDMMKLERGEASILAEALKTHTQLCLSMEDRSIGLLCYSYRVLLDILNILDTKTPFTITEEDQKLLVENLKDALVLGFDKEWLESVKTKVFNCDVSEVHRMQQVLNSLENKLETNETELAIVYNQEDEAARKVEVAQKELEAVRALHYQLSKECQDIQKQRYQYRETIASKFRHFGF